MAAGTTVQEMINAQPNPDPKLTEPSLDAPDSAEERTGARQWFPEIRCSRHVFPVAIQSYLVGIRLMDCMFCCIDSCCRLMA